MTAPLSDASGSAVCGGAWSGCRRGCSLQQLMGRHGLSCRCRFRFPMLVRKSGAALVAAKTTLALCTRCGHALAAAHSLPVLCAGELSPESRKTWLGRCQGLILTALGHGAARGRQHGCVKMGRRHSHKGHTLEGSPRLSPCGLRAATGTVRCRTTRKGLSPCVLRALPDHGLHPGLPADWPWTQPVMRLIDCFTQRCLTCRARVTRAEHQGRFRSWRQAFGGPAVLEQSQRQAFGGPAVLQRWQP